MPTRWLVPGLRNPNPNLSPTPNLTPTAKTLTLSLPIFRFCGHYHTLQQVHLAYSGVDVYGNPTGMTVVWTSAAGEAPPVVEYGLKPDE